MLKLWHVGRHASNMAKLSWWPSLLLAAALLSAPASASCIADADPDVLKLQQLISIDAGRALRQAQSVLDGLQREPRSGAGQDDLRAASRIAALYAVQAEAYSVLELDANARATAEKGLALVPNEADPVHLELLVAYSGAVYDSAGIAAAIQTIEAARGAQARGSTADTCLLISRGLLEHRLGREDLAIVTLTQAYRASSTRGAPTETHIISADMLSLVMRGMGDYSQALALNQEKIDWDSEHDATTALSVSRFMRGQILKMMGNFDAAIEEFEKARSYSVALDDPQGIAFADQRICEAHIELGQLAPAQRECSNAMRIFSQSGSADSLKETQVLQARIQLGSGHPELALATMNQVLDHGGEDVAPRIVGSMYEWRARANAALHHYRDAYSDLQEYVERYTAANDAERIRQAGALRARFETDREIERNSSLKRELESSQEQSNRQAQQLRWNTVAAAAGVGVIALLIYFLMANRSYRAQLLLLARQDPLTGLPNRRRTLELALAALEAARANGKPLTVALIDMDHFKEINDRCGHAAGDHVLKEFARAGREALRDTDILGRWGGEEFLLLMPDTPLELAVASLERLRALVFAIVLPSSESEVRVSLSAGLASYDDTVKSFEDLVARADVALYAAKNEGRDLIRLSEADFETSSSGVRRALRQRS
ncbi:MAG TPA: diguanylate cyclase [Steroidobacteraceae bacterium]|nr:diguanylate cyclase [Steroidobacteraceae bacterium]